MRYILLVVFNYYLRIGIGFRIFYSDTRSWIPGKGYPAMDTRSWIPGHGYPVMDTRSWIPGKGYPAKDTRKNI
jgi:hypothetical protein